MRHPAQITPLLSKYCCMESGAKNTDWALLCAAKKQRIRANAPMDRAEYLWLWIKFLLCMFVCLAVASHIRTEVAAIPISVLCFGFVLTFSVALWKATRRWFAVNRTIVCKDSSPQRLTHLRSSPLSRPRLP